MSEVVKIVFDIDTADVKTSTDDLVALGKVTESEIEKLKRLEAEANANKVAFSQLSKELKSANSDLINAKKQFGDTSKEAQSAQKNVDALTDKMAELKNEVKPLDEAFVSLRTQLKLAKEEAVKAAEKYGEFSKEANAARIKAGALADQMGDLNRQVGLLNPEAKAKAFSNLAQGVVGAFSIATGAVQAFGIKNKEVEELAQKLQAALNITQGIASLGQLKEAYQDVKVVLGFTTVAQEALTVANTAEGASAAGAAVATRGFTAALLTNPIFLAVAAIAALAGAMIAMGDDTEEAKTKVDLMTESQKALRDATNGAADAADKLAVAQGNLSNAGAQVRKTYRDNATDVADLNEKIAENNGQIRDNNKIIEKNKNELKNYTDIVKSTAKQVAEGTLSEAQAQDIRKGFLGENTKAGLAAAEANKKLAQTNKEIVETIKQKNQATNLTVEAIKAEDAAQQTEKKKQDAKESASQAKQNAKDREQQAAKEFADSLKLLQLRQDLAVAEATTQEEKLALQQKFALDNYLFEKQRLETSGATVKELEILEAEYNKTRQSLGQQQLDLQKKSEDEQLKSREDFIKKMEALGVKGEQDPIKRIQAENDAIDAAYAEQYAMAVKNGDDTTKINEAYAKAIAGQQEKLNTELNKQNDKQQADNKKSDEEAAKDKIATAQFVFGAISQLSSNLAALQKAQTDQEIADLQMQYDKKLINEKTYNAKLKELKRKQWEADKRAQIASATIGIAQGIINALAVQPANLVPYAIALAGTTGALQLATIIAQKPPQFAKGTLSVPGIDMGRDSVHAILQPGEAVIPTKTNKAYHPTIKAIYEKKISASEINSFVMSRTRSGGSNKVTASVDTYALGRALSKNKTVEVGNANTIGRAMAKELMRSQNPRRS